MKVQIDDLKTVSEAARLVDVVRQTLWNGINNEDLASRTIGGKVFVSLANAKTYAQSRRPYGDKRRKAS